MDEKETWLFAEHMAVDSGHLDAVLAQGADHRIDLLGGYDKVAGDRRLVAASGLEVDHDGGAHGRRNRLAVLRNRVPARHRELIDAAIDFALHADGRV